MKTVAFGAVDGYVTERFSGVGIAMIAGSD
jgi:hypothetical protein